MNIMWISPRPIIGFGDETKAKSSGSWLEAAYESCRKEPSIRLCVISFSVCDNIQRIEDGENVHLIVPYIRPSSKTKMKRFRYIWNNIVDTFTPDIVQLWGTEVKYYQYVLDFFQKTPTLIYVQGLMNKVYRSFFGGVGVMEILRTTTLNDVIHRNGLLFLHHGFKLVKQVERQNISKVKGVIVENDWCADQIKAISNDIPCYRSHLPIKQAFFSEKWAVDKIERYSIFCNAGGALFKGHHYLLKALKLVVRKYPDTKLYIPGTPVVSPKLYSNKSGYQRFIWQIIDSNQLWNNIIFTGPLTSEKMAYYLSHSNVFVMPSTVENHSSSLIEAMIVGTPAVSSFVGGTSSVATDEYNALLYNHEDYESIAGKIIRIFEDDVLANKLSHNSVERMKNRPQNVSNELLKIYTSIIG